MYPPLLTALPPRLLHIILASLLLVTLFSLFQFFSSAIQTYIPPIPDVSQAQPTLSDGGSAASGYPNKPEGWVKPSMQPFDPTKDGTNLLFNDEECDIKFPRLFTEIDIARSRGNAGGTVYRDGADGFVRARIYNGQLYIVAIGKDVWHVSFRISSPPHHS